MAATIQTSTRSGDPRVRIAPIPILPTMKAAEPMPRGQPKLKPSIRARLSVITSASGDRVEYMDDAANQTTVHQPNPPGATMAT
jgi:hypothetical protein